MPLLLVQMGHAGRTSGSTGAPGEQDLTNRLGQAAFTRLNGRNGWLVTLLPADVPKQAYRGDAFCAFHADGNNNPDVDGASVGYQTDEGAALANAWQHWYGQLGWPGAWHADNYTANLSGYYGVRYAVEQDTWAAFIAEVGTITNPADHAYITSDVGVHAAVDALGVALGIIQPDAAEPGRREDETVHGTVTPTEGQMSGKLSIPIGGRVGADDSVVEGARLWFSTGWGQLIKYQAWCVSPNGLPGGYTNAKDALPYNYKIASDAPGYFTVPANTSCVNIAWQAEVEDVPFSWALERWTS